MWLLTSGRGGIFLACFQTSPRASRSVSGTSGTLLQSRLSILACEAFDLELAISRLFVGGSAVVWSSSLRRWTELCARFEIVVVVVVVGGGVSMPCRTLTFSFFTGLPIMTVVERVQEKEATG